MSTKMGVHVGQLLLLIAAGTLTHAQWTRIICEPKNLQTTVYNFSAVNIYENETIQLNRYDGKLLMIMNAATYSNNTSDNYLGMNVMMEKYAASGFEVLAFPCNQFFLQEPANNYSEILNGIKYVRPGNGYVPKFQMFKKIDVNGHNEHPLYTYLKSECGPTKDDFEEHLYYNPKRISDVRWNFETFMVSPSGIPLYRWSPDAPTAAIEEEIALLMDKRFTKDN